MEMFKTDPFFVLRTYIFLGTQIFPEDGTKNASFEPKNYTGNLTLKKTPGLFLDLRRQTYLRKRSDFFTLMDFTFIVYGSVHRTLWVPLSFFMEVLIAIFC